MFDAHSAVCLCFLTETIKYFKLQEDVLVLEIRSRFFSNYDRLEGTLSLETMTTWILPVCPDKKFK